MTSKIDVRVIFRDHFDTMKDQATGKISALDVCVMFVLPAMIGAVSLVSAFQIDDATVGTLISVFSILAGLLINVLVLIYSVSDQTGIEADPKIRDELLRQTFANISYTVIVCIVAVATLALLLFTSGWAQVAISAACVALVINITLSILMILKRLHVLLRSKFPLK